MSTKQIPHPKKKPFVQCQNSDIQRFLKKNCDANDLNSIIEFMKSNGRRYRFSGDIKQLLSQTIFNLKRGDRVCFRVGQNNTQRKRLKDRLVECGLISWEPGHCIPGSSSKHSTMKPTPLFFAVLDRLCQLKVEKKKSGHIGYWEDSKTLGELIRLNEFMRKHSFQSPIGTIDHKHRFNYLQDPKGKVVRNRLINAGQNIKQELRDEITIDGDPTKSFDVTATHPQLIHQKYLQKRMSFDPYDIALGNKLLRSAAKIALMIMLNTKTRRGAIQSFIKELEKDKNRDIRAAVILNGKEAKIIDAVADRNPDLNQFFYVRMYVPLQKLEANILWSCQQKLAEMKIPSLSVHDDVRVQQQHLDTAIQVYNDCWMTETGLDIEPLLKIK